VVFQAKNAERFENIKINRWMFRLSEKLKENALPPGRYPQAADRAVGNKTRRKTLAWKAIENYDNMKMKYLLLYLSTIIAFEAFPQRNVSGTVVLEEDGGALPGTIIQEEGIKYVTFAESAGVFRITTTKDTCILIFSYVGCATRTVRITQDTILHVVLVDDPSLTYDKWYIPRRFYLGTNYEAINSMFGLTFSNGYDHLWLIHFEDFPDRLIYKMNVHTNFYGDYSFGAHAGWQYPLRHISLITAGYQQYQYHSKSFFHRDIHISAATILKNSELTLKAGYQTLNDYRNMGISAGLQKTVIPILSIGFSAGYYFDYLTFSAYSQGIINRNIRFRLGYDRIDRYDFINLGLNFNWRRW
jgi:hypothetical protein